MDCPVCKEAMVTFELQEVEVDHCLECGGIWLDAGELQQLLGQAEAAAELLNSFTPQPNSTEKPRKCPICLKKMRKIAVAGASGNLLIDKCVKGHGLWFDKGELQNIVESARLDKDNKIRQLLAEVFGSKQQ